jgi:hypothetical protein
LVAGGVLDGEDGPGFEAEAGVAGCGLAGLQLVGCEAQLQAEDDPVAGIVGLPGRARLAR